MRNRRPTIPPTRKRSPLSPSPPNDPNLRGGIRRPAIFSPLQEARPSRRASSFQETPHVRSEEHTSELQSLMRISYAVFCLKKKTPIPRHIYYTNHFTTIHTHNHY